MMCCLRDNRDGCSQFLNLEDTTTFHFGGLHLLKVPIYIHITYAHNQRSKVRLFLMSLLKINSFTTKFKRGGRSYAMDHKHLARIT